MQTGTPNIKVVLNMYLATDVSRSLAWVRNLVQRPRGTIQIKDVREYDAEENILT
jgi:hypothetical protein